MLSRTTSICNAKCYVSNEKTYLGYVPDNAICNRSESPNAAKLWKRNFRANILIWEKFCVFFVNSSHLAEDDQWTRGKEWLEPCPEVGWALNVICWKCSMKWDLALKWVSFSEINYIFPHIIFPQTTKSISNKFKTKWASHKVQINQI